MIVNVLEIKFYAPWVHSLKEKRMIVKSICQRLKNTFNLSVIESEAQDIHQTVIIAMAFLTLDHAQADSTKEKILEHIEKITEAEIVQVNFEQL